MRRSCMKWLNFIIDLVSIDLPQTVASFQRERRLKKKWKNVKINYLVCKYLSISKNGAELVTSPARAATPDTSQQTQQTFAGNKQIVSRRCHNIVIDLFLSIQSNYLKYLKESVDKRLRNPAKNINIFDICGIFKFMDIKYNFIEVFQNLLFLYCGPVQFYL